MTRAFLFSLAVVAACAAAAPSSAQSRYILRYAESEPLDGFLARYGLAREATVAGRPIHAVVDPQDRDPATLIGQIDDDSDGDVSIEVDQRVALPLLSLTEPQLGGVRPLMEAMGRQRAAEWYGATVAQGVLAQPAVRRVRADLSWRLHGIGAGRVAIVDTGVDPSHPFLAANLEPGVDLLDPLGDGSELNGLAPDVRALINPTTTPLLRKLHYLSFGTAPYFEGSVRQDPRLASVPLGLGHGTMVAGAVRLVAPGARLIPIRAFGQDGYARLFDVIRAIHTAEDRGARVVNLSFNLLTPSAELERTTEEVSDRGVILVASTGNDGLTLLGSYPAAYPKVTGVASVDALGRRSAFSNAAPVLTDVAAPGEGLLLPFPGNRWAGGWGTSFAAPLVSGLAAKLLPEKPDATYSDLQSVLSRSAPSPDPNLGAGVLDVAASMDGW